MALSPALLAFQAASNAAAPLPGASPSSSSSGTSSSTMSLPPGASILLTDSLAVSAQPWLVHYVARALRPAGQRAHSGSIASGAAAGHTSGPSGSISGAGGTEARRVIVLGVKEREEWWVGVLKKSGIQLANERASGQFRYLSLADPAVSLAESFALLRETLQDDVSGEAHGPLVVLDDVSALAWMAPEVRDVLRWWNGVRSLLGPARATLLTLQHYAPSPSAGIEEDPSDTWLFRSLLQRSDLWLQVEPVGGGGGGGAASSGAATSGEVSVHLAPSYLPVSSATLDPLSGALSSSGPNARPFWVDEAAGGVEVGIKGRERAGGAAKWA